MVGEVAVDCAVMDRSAREGGVGEGSEKERNRDDATGEEARGRRAVSGVGRRCVVKSMRLVQAVGLW